MILEKCMLFKLLLIVVKMWVLLIIKIGFFCCVDKKIKIKVIEEMGLGLGLGLGFDNVVGLGVGLGLGNEFFIKVIIF